MSLQKFDVQVSGHYPDEDDRIYGNDGEFVDADIAQDLYNALLSAEQSIATFMRVHGYSSESGAGHILAKVKAALAKARGES